jgi:hypothetical protein
MRQGWTILYSEAQWHACSRESIREARRKAEAEMDTVMRHSGAWAECR